VSDLEDSGNHGAAPRPWIVVRNGADHVDYAAILDDFAGSVEAAGQRIRRAAERLRELGPGHEFDTERNAILTLLRGFLRRTISSQIVAFSVLGDDLSGPVAKDPP
jgi:hypothetical protein